jgi:hypothetical protein
MKKADAVRESIAFLQANGDEINNKNVKEMAVNKFGVILTPQDVSSNAAYKAAKEGAKPPVAVEEETPRPKGTAPLTHTEPYNYAGPAAAQAQPPAPVASIRTLDAIRAAKQLLAAAGDKKTAKEILEAMGN